MENIEIKNLMTNYEKKLEYQKKNIMKKKMMKNLKLKIDNGRMLGII